MGARTLLLFFRRDGVRGKKGRMNERRRLTPVYLFASDRLKDEKGTVERLGVVWVSFPCFVFL
jgi:hypothetical protein